MQNKSKTQPGWERLGEKEREGERGIHKYVRTYIHTYMLSIYMYIFIYIYMYNICMYMGVHMATMFHVNKMLGPWHVWSPWRSGGALVGWVEQFRSRSPGEEEGMDGMDRAGTFFIETEIDRGKKEIEREIAGVDWMRIFPRPTVQSWGMWSTATSEKWANLWTRIFDLKPVRAF